MLPFLDQALFSGNCRLPYSSSSRRLYKFLCNRPCTEPVSYTHLLAPIIPTETGISLLIDCGANVDARPEHLLQFAKMGSVYMENVVGIKNPRVAIVNIGAEEEKGNALVKETFPLLKECEDINFVGSIEAREIPHGGAAVSYTHLIIKI